MTQTPSKASGDEQRGAEASHPTAILPLLQSSSLLQGRNEVLIQHGTETYRLRVTKAGKLMLQK
jgi:hemin uptake protein HemP